MMIISLIINSVAVYLNSSINIRHKRSGIDRFFCCHIHDKVFFDLNIFIPYNILYVIRKGECRMGKVPRMLAIHDMSCVGRCSLTAVLPVTAACGIQAVPLPTAVFSNHLAFAYGARTDFTEHMISFMDAWDRNGIRFDAVYSGYLASPAQAGIVKEAIGRYAGGGVLVMVDPAMADFGRLYTGYTENMVAAMRELTARAYIIKPNYTEACMLAERPYEEKMPSPQQVKKLMDDLSDGPEEIVITSVPAEDGMLMNVCREHKEGDIRTVRFPLLPMRTCGTGDIFSSIITAMRMKKVPLYTAVQKATEFLTRVISDTIESGTPREEGVQFENRLSCLSDFMERNQRAKREDTE